MYFILKIMLNLFTACKKSTYIHCLVCILLTFTFHLEGNSLLRNRKIHSTYLKLWLFWYSWGKCLFRTKVSPSNRKSLILFLKALRMAIYNPTLEFGGINVALRLLTFEKKSWSEFSMILMLRFREKMIQKLFFKIGQIHS